jgi:hypothetical protein
MTDYSESPQEEEDRLDAFFGARAEDIVLRVAALDAEGVGYSLSSSLNILLDPDVADYSAERRKADIVTVVLGMIANREFDQAAAAAAAAQLSQTDA